MTQPVAPHLDEGNPRLLLIEDRLGEPLAAFISTRRPHIAWRRIAIELSQRTRIDITGEWLRIWHQSVSGTDATAAAS